MPCARDRNRRIVLIALSGALALAACSSGDHAVQLTVHLDQAQAWEVTGAPVSAGVVCPSGDRTVVGFEDLEGDPLTAEEGMERMQVAAESAGEVVAYRILFEHTCSDGSGAFILRSIPTAATTEWVVVSGSSSYDGLSGEGTCELETAPWEEGDPPEGMPMTLHCSGEMKDG